MTDEAEEGLDRSTTGSSQSDEMPRLNFKRLMQEFSAVKRAVVKGAAEASFLHQCAPLEDNLLEWEVHMVFPLESPLQRSLQELRERDLGEIMGSADAGPAALNLRMRFPTDFPASPPEVWVCKPRLKRRSGAPVSFGGRLCFQEISSSGWAPATTVLAVLKVVYDGLLAADGTVVDTTLPFTQCYAAPPSLERLKTELFPTANNFKKNQQRVISPQAAENFLGDLSLLEATDKIALPFDYAEAIYAPMQRGGNIELPLIFEVKSDGGRKCHCAIYDFIVGLPPGHILLPKWVMEDLFIDDYATVAVRGVVLPLISFVKVQPHSVDFYRAVQESSVDVKQLLTQSLARFSALTEDTCVPIDIKGEAYFVQVAQLAPRAAVRIIDCDVQHHFEFEVDFEPAPDLEDEDAMRERQDRIIAKMKARRALQEQELEERAKRRTETIRSHFEAAKKAATAAAADLLSTSSTGKVELLIRLPDGSQFPCCVDEGAPLVALIAAVLQSDWAAAACPWGVRLLGGFPPRPLTDPRVTKDLHRSRIGVLEEQPPEDDETLFQLSGSPMAASGSFATGLGSPMSMQSCGSVVEEAVPLPPLFSRSISHVQRQTEEAYEVQRWMLTGLSREAAVEQFQRGERLPVGVAAPPPPNPLARSRSQTTAESLARTQSQEEERVQQVQSVINFTASDYAEALAALEAVDWNTEQAINALLDGVNAEDSD
mmetsp:Transcript_50480/g.117851  ORF Transcript_50480/g.117851 Transcript_50480/m.117851 type:complete len:713 (-) Transcript_50480:135-2273(-)